MHLEKHIRRLPILIVGLFVVSCATGEGPVAVDASWNLTCPVDSAVECGARASTCLGNSGQRTVVGANGDISCDEQIPIIVDCGAIDRPNGERTIFLETAVGSGFAFELRGATVDDGNGGVQAEGCTVTIVEDGLPYDVGDCGPEPPSMAQPCQITNVISENGEVGFDLECRSLISSVTGNGFNVGAVGGGPTTISFSNCRGL